MASDEPPDDRAAAAPAPEGLSDTVLLDFWRSVQGPHAELTGPLIRYAALIWAVATSSPSPALSDEVKAEHAEMLWGLRNVHMLARRAMNAPNEAKCREKLPHIIRICERQAPEPLTGGVLRARPALSDEVLREMAKEWLADDTDLTVGWLVEFARAVLARQQAG